MTVSDLERARWQLHLSRGEFAGALGVSVGTVRRWRDGGVIPHWVGWACACLVNGYPAYGGE